MLLSIAVLEAQRLTRVLAESALPRAAVVPVATEVARAEHAAWRIGLAAALRRSADRLTPVTP